MDTPSSSTPSRPRCQRCARAAAVVVRTEAGRKAGREAERDVGRAPLAACVEHLEWAFLLDVDEWSGRRRTA
ncbi:hypothetical protein [Pseudonocardia sp.]|uniref:hypothetical protein n=1 Tax=Pseudonocardia sp. TaxID=60912 RepID=UPI003D12A611